MHERPTLESLNAQAAELDKRLKELPDWVRLLFNQRVVLARAIDFHFETALVNQNDR